MSTRSKMEQIPENVKKMLVRDRKYSLEETAPTKDEEKSKDASTDTTRLVFYAITPEKKRVQVNIFGHLSKSPVSSLKSQKLIQGIIHDILLIPVESRPFEHIIFLCEKFGSKTLQMLNENKSITLEHFHNWRFTNDLFTSNLVKRNLPRIISTDEKELLIKARKTTKNDPVLPLDDVVSKHLHAKTGDMAEVTRICESGHSTVTRSVQ